MAQMLAGVLPGLIEENSHNPLSFNTLMNAASYELWGKQSQQAMFEQQNKMAGIHLTNQERLQQNQFMHQQNLSTIFSGNQMNMQQAMFTHQNAFQRNGALNTLGLNAENHRGQLELQQNQFANSASAQQSAFGYQTKLNSQNIKGNLMNTGAQIGGNLLTSGLGMLGNFLNYKYNTKLQDQAFQNNNKLAQNQFNRVTGSFEKEGVPGWAAFAGGNLTSMLPHDTQVLSGTNTRTAAIPGHQTSFFSNTGSQAALGLGVVNTA